MKMIREPAVSGGFYPDNPAKLREAIASHLSSITPPHLEGRVAGLISPHAGYVYSGETAAYGYSLLRGSGITRVIILAPSHSVPFRGASIPGVDAYRTPLGLVPLDGNACATLRQHKGFSTIPEAHAREHSLEVQLPFLQEVLGDFSLVPIVLGQLEDRDYTSIAGPLRKLLDDTTVIIASTDFTHFGHRFGYVPFRDNLKENISRLDHGALDCIAKMDRAAFVAYQNKTGATICGHCSIGVLLETLPENTEGRLLHYSTSGDLTGDYENSVSYVSMAFILSGDNEEEYLSDGEKKTLLSLARETISRLMNNEALPGAPKDRITEKLRNNSGVFVTLHKHGMLRGCIGYIEPVKPLWEAVRDNAVSAAVRDYRFPPLRQEELDDIEIEISVLTPTRKIASPDEFVAGKHGIILRKDGRSAVFLPQVAPEQCWGVEDTLTHLSVKAGLPPDAWREGAEFLVFEAIVFGE